MSEEKEREMLDGRGNPRNSKAMAEMQEAEAQEKKAAKEVRAAKKSDPTQIEVIAGNTAVVQIQLLAQINKNLVDLIKAVREGNELLKEYIDE